MNSRPDCCLWPNRVLALDDPASELDLDLDLAEGDDLVPLLDLSMFLRPLPLSRPLSLRLGIVPLPWEVLWAELTVTDTPERACSNSDLNLDTDAMLGSILTFMVPDRAFSLLWISEIFLSTL